MGLLPLQFATAGLRSGASGSSLPCTRRCGASGSWHLPDEFVPRRYAEIVHGIGLGVEYPVVYYPQDAPAWQYPGMFADGMCVCVESYIGSEHGEEGVKLEQPVHITANGPVPLTNLRTRLSVDRPASVGPSAKGVP